MIFARQNFGGGLERHSKRRAVSRAAVGDDLMVRSALLRPSRTMKMYI